MVRYRFLRSAALALGVYGVLGLFIASAMLVVSISTFSQVEGLQRRLESERLSLVQSIRTVSGTLRDTAGATVNFQQSINDARGAADRASKLANDSAGTFRDLGTRVAAITVLGFQPLAGLSPEFNNSADQLQQLAISMGTTRDALAQNGQDVRRVGSDLSQLQTELEAVAATLSQPGALGMETQSLLPFEIAFYGMCLLVLLQSAFSIVAAIMLYRLQLALGPTDALFPFARSSGGALARPEEAGLGGSPDSGRRPTERSATHERMNA
jgi:hypothetical protein